MHRKDKIIRRKQEWPREAAGKSQDKKEVLVFKEEKGTGKSFGGSKGRPQARICRFIKGSALGGSAQ